MSWMAKCQVFEVGVGLEDDEEAPCEGPYVIMRCATIEDARMLGGALYQEVFVEPGTDPSGRSVP